MMYSFILLSLVVAVYCHQPVPELYDADKYEAKVKRLDEVEELIDRVTTRIQNLKDKRELRQKQKDDADRRSKSILLRLDRMKLNDGSFHCDKPDKEFKCRKNTQCVNNILVCDNVPDCEDKSDEDPDLCRVPLDKDIPWAGPQSYYACTTTESTDHYVSIILKSEERSKLLPSRAKLLVDSFWTYQNYKVSGYRMEGYYNYATSKLGFPTLPYEGQLLNFNFIISEDTMYGGDHFAHSGVLCGPTLLRRNESIASRLENMNF